MPIWQEWRHLRTKVCVVRILFWCDLIICRLLVWLIHRIFVQLEEQRLPHQFWLLFAGSRKDSWTIQLRQDHWQSDQLHMPKSEWLLVHRNACLRPSDHSDDLIEKSMNLVVWAILEQVITPLIYLIHCCLQICIIIGRKYFKSK